MGSTPRQLFMAVPLIVVVVLCLAIELGAGSAANSGRCRVTVPPPGWKPSGFEFGPGHFNYGNARIRAHIWPGGRLVAGTLPGGGSWATVGPDGSIRAKLGWWRGVPGRLVIAGRRLDAPAPPLRAHVPPATSYGEVGFIPSGVTFPTVGCWRVVGKQGGATLTFVVEVTRVKGSRRTPG